LSLQLFITSRDVAMVEASVMYTKRGEREKGREGEDDGRRERKIKCVKR
jgi:hypothetical protein